MKNYKLSEFFIQLFKQDEVKHFGFTKVYWLNLYSQIMSFYSIFNIYSGQSVMIISNNHLLSTLLLVFGLIRGFAVHIVSTKMNMNNVAATIINNNFKLIIIDSKYADNMRDIFAEHTALKLPYVVKMGGIIQSYLVGFSLLLEFSTDMEDLMYKNRKLQLLSQKEPVDLFQFFELKHKTHPTSLTVYDNENWTGRKAKFNKNNAIEYIVEAISTSKQISFDNKSVVCNYDFGSYPFLNLALFSANAHLTTGEGDYIIFDNDSFLNFWKNKISNVIEEYQLSSSRKRLSRKGKRMIKNIFAYTFGSYEKLIILNAKLPHIVSMAMIESGIDYYTTYGKIFTGNFNFINHVENIYSVDDMGLNIAPHFFTVKVDSLLLNQKNIYKMLIEIPSYCEPNLGSHDSITTLDWDIVVNLQIKYTFFEYLKSIFLNKRLLVGKNIVFGEYDPLLFGTYGLITKDLIRRNVSIPGRNTEKIIIPDEIMADDDTPSFPINIIIKSEDPSKSPEYKYLMEHEVLPALMAMAKIVPSKIAEEIKNGRLPLRFAIEM